MSSIVDFENRLVRMQKHTGKWARRQGITCYRLFDCDLPKFDFTIDRYEDCVCLSDYRGDELLLSQIVPIVSRITQVPGDKIFVRRREVQRGSAQYSRREEEGYWVTAQEAGLKFKLNLSSYLDTGLFLDHRITRSMVRAEAEGKDFLNLFAYTGSFSVYAAAGNARSTMTIDLSKTYCDWAQENLKLNGFESRVFYERDHEPLGQIMQSPGAHRILQMDALKALSVLPAESFDLAVLDPPSFSNSKRMDGTFDVQRDHPAVIAQVLRTLRKGGVLYFSNNFSRFKLRPEELEGCSAKDITKQTIANDFRDKKAHWCFRITKEPGNSAKPHTTQ